MTHQQVIENFIKEGKGGRGTNVKANQIMLYTQGPVTRWSQSAGYETDRQQVPLAVRLKDDSLLANGAALDWLRNKHQRQVLRSLENAHARFGVVPFHSIVAAWTDGEKDNWDQTPIPIRDVQREVAIVVPSEGERWKDVESKDKYGHTEITPVHTLGDSVIRVKDRFYLSAVDETGVGAGMYFLAELATDQPPASLADAFNALKPPVVREAEARRADVRRQGEWFAIPTKLLTSELMRDVASGIAVYRLKHVLGRDGHHELEEAVIYKAGERKGQVFARGVLAHTKDEHYDLDLGTIRWYRVVHNIQGASYTLTGGGTAQFD
jgi:hypothetical protein